MHGGRGRPNALTVLAWAEHLLFVLLAAVAAARLGIGPAGPGRTALGALAAVALLGWYAGGAALARRSGRTWAGPAWLGGLVVLWAAAMPLSSDFVWLAFPLFFLCMHLLPLRWALPSVAVITGAAVVGYGASVGFSVAGVLGPAIGAGVAVVMSAVYQTLQRESERRRLLLAELVETQAQLAATERQAGRLAERERLAREIHDTVAQGLSSIVLLLRAAEGEQGEDVRRHVRTASATARQALDETRRVVRALAPAALDGRPLTDALRRLAEDAREGAGLDAEFTVDGEPCALPTGVEVALLRVAQGALANTVAHAGARRVRMALAFQPDAVTMDVADDGRGFDAAAVEAGRGRAAETAGTGFGLRAMRGRLAEVGGELVVESAPGEGTAVAARIPLDAASGGAS
ncbi:hypothetical protein BIV57_18995 [Mangrovactinospora gilvigrisea]|uniref:Oxygen sensor histidine kinase NreB n=2 Tax=Mangrovactinospora gilvigrisea TaxID=1428644 RepID=A0A1J7C2Y9_9ACTN|nr:hypothetical protein BIV57_18995 [Mangrovactinospora gilvigrisea]